MNLGETYHLKRCDLVTVWWMMLLLPLWLHAAALWCHAGWICIVTSHNAWMGYEHSLQNLNCPWASIITSIILTPSKQWGMCDKWYIQITATSPRGQRVNNSNICNTYMICVLLISVRLTVHEITNPTSVGLVFHSCWLCTINPGEHSTSYSIHLTAGQEHKELWNNNMGW